MSQAAGRGVVGYATLIAWLRSGWGGADETVSQYLVGSGGWGGSTPS
jgi:hypothetical protein